MKKVSIIGSKPDSILPESDIAYFTNASILQFTNELDPRTRIINVINGNNIGNRDKTSKNFRKENFTSNIVKEIRHFVDHEFILYNTEGNNSLEILLEEGVKQDKITIISREERDRILENITGLQLPIGIWSTVKQTSLYNLGRLIYTGIFKRYFLSNKSDHSAFFRPSTGVFGILFAINRHGFEPDYMVSGIGFKDRGTYKIGHKKVTLGKREFEDIEIHVIPDKIVFENLLNNNRISMKMIREVNQVSNIKQPSNIKQQVAE